MSDGHCRDDQDRPRKNLPTEVFAKHTDYVTVGMKRITAERVAGWLGDAAQMYDIGGAHQSAKDARGVGRHLMYEVGQEIPEKLEEDGGGEDDTNE